MTRRLRRLEPLDHEAVHYLVQAYDAVRDLSKYGRKLVAALEELRRRLR